MDTSEKLDRISGDQAAILARLAVIEQRLMSNAAAGDDREQRLRAVERWVWGIPASLVTGAAAFIASYRS